MGDQGHERRQTAKHGLSRTRAYSIWVGMRARCRPGHLKYEEYGGRGISVCERWSATDGTGIKNFIEDMGHPPDGMTLDRIDNEKGYYKDNCRWATDAVQHVNMRRVHRAAARAGGGGPSLRAIAAKHGIHWKTLQTRLRRGWPSHEATTRPVRKYGTGKRKRGKR